MAKLSMRGITHLCCCNWRSFWSITHLCCCNWRSFWRKNVAGRLPKGSYSCKKMPRFTGHLQPRRKLTTWVSIVLITHPILRIWPRQTTTGTMGWKNKWKIDIFRPTQMSLLPMRPGWTDSYYFFWVACKI